jgi:fumarylacetoacetase
LVSPHLEAWQRTSWVESANDPACGFPLQSLPYCVYRDEGGSGRLAVGIGDSILDLHQCDESGLFAALPENIREACRLQTLNQLIACTRSEQATLRSRLMHLLDADTGEATWAAVLPALLPRQSASLLKPVEPPNFTDFYASIHHATRVGELFRPDQPLLPNYKFVPIGYHGRASSVVASGTSIRRPNGQTKPAEGGSPDFAPTRSLDYELEVGAYITPGNHLGDPISIHSASEHIFGLSLLNDWSARDIQSWEYQPLGPFLAKSFATTVSPWVVPMDAFTPFRIPVEPRSASDPAPLPYLSWDEDQQAGAIDLTLEVFLLTENMRSSGQSPHRMGTSNLRHLYWTLAQLVTHHTSNGCNLVPGDLLGTGTVSGPQVESAGCLLELSQGGKQTILLPHGERRTYLEDGDEVLFRGFCSRTGFPKISLGECRGIVTPAI